MAISGNQLKAARALAGIDQQELATLASVGINTVRNMEAAGAESIRARTSSLDAIVSALEARGIEFTNGRQPGVRITHPEALDQYSEPKGPATEVVKAMDAAIKRDRKPRP